MPTLHFPGGRSYPERSKKGEAETSPFCLSSLIDQSSGNISLFVIPRAPNDHYIAPRRVAQENKTFFLQGLLAKPG